MLCYFDPVYLKSKLSLEKLSTCSPGFTGREGCFGAVKGSLSAPPVAYAARAAFSDRRSNGATSCTSASAVSVLRYAGRRKKAAAVAGIRTTAAQNFQRTVKPGRRSPWSHASPLGPRRRGGSGVLGYALPPHRPGGLSEQQRLRLFALACSGRVPESASGSGSDLIVTRLKYATMLGRINPARRCTDICTASEGSPLVRRLRANRNLAGVA